MPDIILKPKTDPLLKGLSGYLKDPANFQDIQKKILDTLSTTCSHSDVLAMAGCIECTNKMIDRRRLLKKLGFKNPAQYMAWRKIHAEIARRFPLMDWKTKKPINLNG